MTLVAVPGAGPRVTSGALSLVIQRVSPRNG
jgi:hypothetical protein